MNRGFNEFKESILGVKREVESNSRSHCVGEGSLLTCSLLIMLISIIAMLVITLPACSKADFNQNASSGADSNTSQTAYLKGFDEGYYLGGLYVLAQSNATIAEEYDVLVQQHNDLLNKTLSEENAESNLLAKVPIPAIAPRKPVDPWEL